MHDRFVVPYFQELGREINKSFFLDYRLDGLVVRVPGYRSRVSGSIPGTTRFSEK
jgi:hypothetical protein